MVLLVTGSENEKCCVIFCNPQSASHILFSEETRHCFLGQWYSGNSNLFWYKTGLCIWLYNHVLPFYLSDATNALTSFLFAQSIRNLSIGIHSVHSGQILSQSITTVLLCLMLRSGTHTMHCFQFSLCSLIGLQSSKRVYWSLWVAPWPVVELKR